MLRPSTERALSIEPGDGAVRLKLADAYRRSQQGSLAAREAIRAADLLPHDDEAQLQAVESMMALSRFGDALTRLTPVRERRANDPRVVLLFAQAKAKLPSPTWALSRIDEALRRGREFDAVRVNLRPRTTEADDREAEEAFRRVLELDPAMFNARLALTGLLWIQGRLDEGSEILKTVVDRSRNAFLNRALGLAYRHRGRESDAEHYLEIAASSRDHEAELALADLYVATGRHEEALKLLNAASQRESPAGSATLRVAEVALSVGRFDSAARQAELILERDPLNARALSIRAEVLLARGDTGAATAAARAAVTSSPAASRARLVLARCLVAGGDTESAFSELAEAWRLDQEDPQLPRELSRLALLLGRTRVASEFARQAVRLNALDRDSTVTLVRALIGLRDWRGAERALGPLLTGEPDAADARALLASIQAGRGDTAAARTNFLRALQSAPDSLDALAGLVAIEISTGQTLRARQRVADAAPGPRISQGHQLLLGHVLAADGDVAASEAVYRRLLADDPSHVQAARRLAELLYRQERSEEARAVLGQLLEKQPAAADARVELATLLEEADRFTDARAQYEKVLADNPHAPVALYRLAALEVYLGQNLDVALTRATTALESLPDDPAAKDVVGWILVRKGLARSGLPYLVESVRAEPENAAYRYHLGVAYIATGQPTKGRIELQQALAIGGDFRFAADAKAALASASR